MGITILPLEDNKRYNVNGHAVYKNDNGHWISATAMSTKEWAAFHCYEKVVIKNKAFKKHTKATYKG